MKKVLRTVFIAIAFCLSGVSYSQHCVDNTFNPLDFGLNSYGPNTIVYSSAIQTDGKFLIGGSFTSYNGTTGRNRIIRLNTDGTFDATFTGTGANNTVNAIAIQPDGKILIGGLFTSYNGTAINRIARLNADGSLDNTFTLGTGADNSVLSIALQTDGKILIGGTFLNYNGTAINRFARLNSNGTLDGTFTTGTGPSSTIERIVIQPADGKILIGGAFITYNGTANINRINRINTDGTLDGTFTGTGANSTVNSIAIQPADGKILIGGAFTSYNGTAGRNRIIRLNTDGSFDATFTGTGTNNTVISIAIQPADGKILIGGSFTSYNGTAGRNRIIRLNTDGSFDATFTGTGADNTVYSIPIQTDGKILIAGNFGLYNNTERNNFTRLNANGTLDMTFNPGTSSNGDIVAIAVQTDGKILIGGSFTTYDGYGRNRIARLNADGSLDITFDPGAGTNNTVFSIAVQTDGKILIGGAFTSYNGIAGRNRIIRLNNDGTFDATFTGTGANNTVNSIAIQPADGQILIGGAFTSYNGVAGRNRIIRLNTSDGTFDATFTGTGTSSNVYSISIQTDGKIIIGGAFAFYNGTSRNYIARVNTDGTLDLTFDPGTGCSSSVQATAIQPDGKILIGGTFTTYNGTAINRIARINTSGSLDGTFIPGTGANGTINTLAIQPSGTILIGEIFTTYNGIGRNRIAQLSTNGSLDLCFNPGTGFPATVNAILQSGGNNFISGTFTSYNGVGKNRIVKLTTCDSYALSKGTCLNYGPVVVSVAKKDSFYIKNPTCTPINVTNVTKSTSQYTITSPTVFTIAAYDSGKVAVTFIPSSVAIFLDTVRIFNTAVDTFVCLSGNGIPPPVITISPASYSVTLGCTDSISLPLIIGNTGGSDLIYNLEGGGGAILKVALVAAEGSPGYRTDVQSKLMATGKFSQVDIFTANTMTPSLAQLQQYDAVLVWSNTGFSNATLMGDNLADYVDAGGGVVASVFTTASVPLAGRFNTSNYWCINPSGQTTGQQSLGTVFLPNHFIMKNVTSFNGGTSSWRQTSTLVNPLATRVADWTDGRALVATRKINNSYRADLGMFPPSNDALGGCWLPSTNGALLMANALNYSFNGGGVEWMTLAPTTNTVTPSGSSTVTVTFNSTGMLIGTYTTTIVVTSNDPANPSDTIPVTLNVVGTPDFVFAGLGDTVAPLCLDLDSIMAFTTSTDTIYITNTGCDTLWLDSTTFSPSVFSLDTLTSYIIPGDTGGVVVLFSPTSAGSFTGTLNLYTNDLDTTFCLKGKAFVQPIICWNPDTFNITVACSDSLTDTLFICNTRGTTLNWNLTIPSGMSDDFDPAVDGSVWSVNNGFISANCGSFIGNALYFNDAGIRQAATYDMNTVYGGTVNFYIRLGSGGACEYLDPGEDVVLEYSNNGGGSWTNISTFLSGNYFVFTPFTFVIPVAAKTLSTRFRWRQLNHSGSCCDHWALDNVSVNLATFVSVSPTSGTTPPADTDTVLVEFNSLGLNVGQYISGITISSNDPITPFIIVPCTLNVVGTADFEFAGFADTIAPLCLDLDSIMEFSTSTDTIFIANIGCDTLDLDSTTFSPSVFSFDNSSFPIAPGDTGWISVLFSPITSPVSFTGTVNVYTYDLDTVFCLKGKSFQRPIISVDPDSFNITLTCNDSITDTLTIYNTGGGSPLNYTISLAPSISGAFLYDGFENGGIASWNIGSGIYTRTVTTISPANGTYAFQLTGGNLTYYDGIDHSFPSSTANYISYKFKSPVGSTFWNCGVNVGNSADIVANGAIADSWIDNAAMTVYLWCSSGTYTVPMVQGQWYQIEYRNINYTAKTFDYYVNGNLVGAGLVFGNVAITSINTIHLMGWDAGHTSYYDEIIIGNDPTAWLFPSPLSGTSAPLDSSKVAVEFVSTNLLIGTYYGNILVNSNDPLSPLITVPCTLNVVGAPDFELEALFDTIAPLCLDLDSIMEFTTSTDSIGITNLGCDTLWLDSLIFAPSVFSLVANDTFILPGDTGGIVVQFSPLAPGTYTGTLNVYTNDLDTVFCLKGYAYPRPIICHSPDSFIITIPACLDTVIDYLMICNSGLSDLSWCIQVANPASPTGYCPAIHTSGCGVGDLINNFSFNTLSKLASGCNGQPNSYIYDQSVTTTVQPGGTYPISMQCGPAYTQGFGVWIDYNRDGDYLDAGEFVYASPTWGFGVFSSSVTIPLTATIGKTRMRVRCKYNGTVTSGESCSSFSWGETEEYDIVIGSGGNVIPVPLCDTTAASDTTIITVYFTNTGLPAGTYNIPMFINSNDPFNPQDTVTVILTINTVGPPAPSANDTAVCFGNPTPPLIATGSAGDTIKWYDDGALTNLVYTGGTFVSTQTVVGTYTYYVTATDSVYGCESLSDTAILTISSPPSAPTAGSNSPACTGQNLSLTASTIIGAIYNWSGPNSFTSTTQNPVIASVTTAAAGTYSVTATLAGCPASAAGTTTVVVNQTPASPTAGSNSPICAGSDLSLTASTVGSSTYSWIGPNSFTSTTQNPVISPATAAATGNYSVTATENGCTSPAGTTSVTVTGIPAAPTAGYISPVCTGTTLSLTASTIAGATYSWNGPNSFTATVQNPTIASVTTAASGTYSVFATVNGCAGATATVSITVNVTPSAPAASALPNPVCSGTTLSLSATAAGSPGYNWSGPNSFVSPLQNPTIASITTAGTGTYSVTATENGCTGPAGTTSVVVNQTPAAPIAGSNSPICVGQNISLTASTVAGSTYNWIGPNSFTSTLQNPVIIGAGLADAGTYSVTATANGCTSPAGTVNVIVNPPPAAPIAGSNSPVCSGQNLSLTASTVGGATYSWNGPNGFTSTVQNPVIISVSTIASGTYSVIAITAGCPPSVAGTTVVTVNQTPSAPVASSNSPVCVGNNISLTASTSGSPTYAWTGPNSFTSSLQNPVIAAAGTVDAGNYSVTATENGCTGPAGTTSVIVNNPPTVPVAGSNSPVCSGQTLSLTASTSGTTYNWNGPNTFTSTVQNPNIGVVSTLASGNYSVTASVPGCPTSAAGTTSVTINQTPSAPTAGSNAPICAGTDLSLTATTGGSPTYSWNGPSSFTSTSQNPVIVAAATSASGNYSVTATEFGCTGPAGTVSVTVNPPPATPAAGSNSPVCSGQTLSLTASTIIGATYNWTGPNAFTSTLQNPTIGSVSTAASGTYSVTATVAGCPASAAGTTTVTINQSPAAPTAGSNSPICAGTDLSLTASTTGSPTYNWNGPNGFTSTSQNPVIISAAPTASGTYSVTATEFGCPSAAGTVSVTVNPIPTAPIVGSNSPICSGQDLSLTATAGGGATYSWNGPNGFTSTSQNPVIIAAGTVDAGTYSVSATENGCTGPVGTVSVTISTTPSTPIAGSNSPVCSGQTLSLTSSSAGSSYSWNGPNGFTSTSQNPTIGSVTTLASGTYSVIAINAGCPASAAGTTTVTINQTPSAPTAGSNSPICAGTDLSLTATTSGSPTYSWNGPSGFTSASQNPVIIAAATSASGTYSVTATGFGCTGPAGTVSVTVNPIPAAPTVGSNSPICAGQNLSLTATAGGSPTYSWNGPSSFTSTSQNPVMLAAATSASGIYSVTATEFGCTGPAGTVSVTVNPIPAAPLATPQSDSICFGTPNPLFSAAGTNIEWWNDAATTILEATGSPFTPTVTATGTYTYYVTQTATGCKSPADTILFVIISTPSLAVNDTTVLFGSPPVVLSAGGTNVQWYDASFILVGSGNSYNTGQTAVGTYTYYVTQTLNGCESALDIVILTIIPGAPLGVNDTVCFGQTVPDLTATGTNIQWYSDPALTILVFTGNPFPTGQTAVGTYTYYVTQTVNFIESPSDTVFLVINPIPAAPTASNQIACFNTTIPDLTATGTNIQWYDMTPALVFSGSPFPTGETAVGTYTYMVTQTAGGCESPADTVTLTITAPPATPVASNDTTICYGDPTPDLTASGTNINWYDGLGNPVGTGSPFASGVTAPGTYTFIATQTNTVTTCESLGDTVLLTINSIAPPVAPDVAVCFGLPVPPLTATGTSIEWYDNLGNPVFSGSPFNTGQTAVGTYTYYVTQTNTVTTCSSPQDTVYLIISTQPTLAPTVSDTDACFGSAIPDLNSTTGTIINWYSDAALTNLVFSGNPFPTGQTAIGSYTFFATDSTPGCPEGPSDPAVLVINSLPATLAVNDTATCFGSPIPDLIAVGNNITWYDTGMVIVSVNDTFATGQTAVGTYTYYVTQTNTVTGCSSVADSVMLTINALPSMPSALDTTVCSAAAIPNLTATGTNVQWYNSAWAFMFTGNSYATLMTAAGTYTYYVTQMDLATGCEGAADTSILTIMLSPPIPTANNVAICFGNPVPPLTSTGTYVQWYDTSGALVFTGNSYNTGQTAVGVYTYWLTDSLTGCVSSGSDSATLTINTLPAEPNANDTTMCYGNPAVLTSTGTVVQWYSDVTLINMVGTGSPFNTGITAVGIYTYYVTDFAAGCGNSPADTVVFTINPAPLVTANTYSTTIVQGNSTTLTAFNAVTYSWAPGGQTTQSIVVSPTVTTTYTVTGTNSFGCSNSVTILVTVNPLGVTVYNEPVQDINIYPNPAISSFTLEFNTTLETPIDIYMINMLGEKVNVIKSADVQGGGLMQHKYLINTSTFTEGVYNVEIVTDKGTVNRRVVLFR